MLPPSFLPDLRVGSSPRPFEERATLRRSHPERLRIDPVPYREGRSAALAEPAGPEPPAAPGRGWFPRLRLVRQAASA